MLNIIRRYGKTGMTWQALSRMFADRGEDELMHQVVGLIKSKQAYAFGGVVYPGPSPKRPGKPKVACYRHDKNAASPA